MYVFNYWLHPQNTEGESFKAEFVLLVISRAHGKADYLAL